MSMSVSGLPFVLDSTSLSFFFFYRGEEIEETTHGRRSGYFTNISIRASFQLLRAYLGRVIWDLSCMDSMDFAYFVRELSPESINGLEVKGRARNEQGFKQD